MRLLLLALLWFFPSVALANDDFITIQSVHSVPVTEQRLKDALDQVHPYMQSHGGSVELISLQGDFARLRLSGSCKSCPSSQVTLELAVRKALEENCPDLAGFEVVGPA